MSINAPAQPPRASALVEQFKNERVFWKQIDIAKAIAGEHDASVLPPLAGWLDHEDRHIRGNVAFIFASLGNPRGIQTIADILADRSERPRGQGIPTAPGDGRYRFERQVAADRYYAAHLLGDLKDPRGLPLLVPLLDDPETQSIVPWSLGQIGDKRAIAPLIAALDNDDPSNRVRVIYALEALHAKEAVPRLLTLVNDDRESRFGARVTVSDAAKAAIANLQSREPSSRHLITASAIGPVRLGMTLDDARRALPGASFSRTSDGDGAALVQIVFGQGDSLSVWADENDPATAIDWSKRIVTVETFSAAFHTREGIHPGSLVTDAARFLGPVREIVKSEIESREYVTFEHQPRALTFRLDDTGIFSPGLRRTTSSQQARRSGLLRYRRFGKSAGSTATKPRRQRIGETRLT